MSRMFGWIDRVDDAFAVATDFVHLGGLPLWPRETLLVDTTSMTTTRERERRLLGMQYRELTSFRSVPLPRNDRSIAAAYLRTWGTICALLGAVAISPAMAKPLAMGGAALLFAGATLRKFSFLRASDQLMNAGFAAMTSLFAAIFLPRPVIAAIGVAGAIGAAITLAWRRATPERAIELGKLLGLSPDTVEQRRTLMARAAGAAPQLPEAKAVVAPPVAPAPPAPRVPRPAPVAGSAPIAVVTTAKAPEPAPLVEGAGDDGPKFLT